ncbi:MAG: ComEC/Rec2-related protein, competence protein ComEC [Parcubacteria group bacterium GW2011_GWC1_41_7]|nr:MAG: ComEC/Rec2-related protein, competence protein ComEC [Parcubacteria group bacterium GW2011_GWC1_41_7]
MLGYAYASLRAEPINEEAIKNLQRQSIVQATIISVPAQKETYQTFLLEKNTVRIRAYAPISYDLQYGDTIQATGTISQNTSPYDFKQNILLRMSIRSLSRVGEKKSLTASLMRMQHMLTQKTQRAVPLYTSDLIGGLLYGKKIENPVLLDAFQKTGLSHVTALSGYNLAIVSSAAFRVFSFFPIPRVFLSLLVLLLLIAFTLFSGASSSVVRACIMIALVLCIKNSGRIPLYRNIFLATALGITLIHPFALLIDIGFQLSFLATAGIVYLAPRVISYLDARIHSQSRVVRTLIALCAETISASVMVLPLLWHVFGQFSPLSFFANILVLPLIPFSMALSALIVCALSFSQLPLILSFPLELLGHFVIMLSAMPVYFISLPLYVTWGWYTIIIYIIVRLNQKESIEFQLPPKQ